MDIRTIRFGDDGQAATGELVKRFESLRPRIAAGSSPALGRLREELKSLEAIDRQYGGTDALELEGAGELVAAAIGDLAHLESDCRRQGRQDASLDLAQLVVGAALWAVRHQVALGAGAVEHVTNALALMSNTATGKAELSAIFGLMYGLVEHVRPALAADLERSNPQRPWRLLHVNQAITAIRTEDPALMDLAFDALDAALPDERAAFYAEALALAMGPRVAAQVRSRIEARHARWNIDAGAPGSL